MSFHSTTFDFHKATDTQVADMAKARAAAKLYATSLDNLLPEGPDKTYLMRKLREVALWANVTITRQSDGEPRW